MKLILIAQALIVLTMGYIAAFHGKVNPHSLFVEVEQQDVVKPATVVKSPQIDGSLLKVHKGDFSLSRDSLISKGYRSLANSDNTLINSFKNSPCNVFPVDYEKEENCRHLLITSFDEK